VNGDSALARADRIGRAAASEGFDWPDVTGPIAKVREELLEVEEVIAVEPHSAERAESELGDLLFSVVNVARHLGVDPERALLAACDRFEARYAGVRARVTPHTTSLVELDAAWEAVKRDEHR
jgi:ATP diphosphatase